VREGVEGGWSACPMLQAAVMTGPNYGQWTRIWKHSHQRGAYFALISKPARNFFSQKVDFRLFIESKKAKKRFKSYQKL
jgi:hypothetical protein